MSVRPSPKAPRRRSSALERREVVCQGQQDATRSASIATEVHDPVQPDAHGAGGCGMLVDDGDFASKRISVRGGDGEVARGAR